jgi:hypothetical protein
MHPLEEAENFNESMYFNAFDPETGLGGFFRVGNRPNEGHGEVTCCLYLPDGRVGFMYQRPEVRTNEALAAAGMRFDVITPFERLRVRYDGPLLLLDDPLKMADPKEAFASNPVVKSHVDLDFAGASPMYGGEPVGEGAGMLHTEEKNPFARGHYEQHVRAQGQIRVADQSWVLRGLGLRDHSWGPRYWQAPWWYRWLNALLDPEFGFMVTVMVQRDGSLHMGGMILDEGRYDTIAEAKVESQWREREGQTYHGAIVARVRTESGRRVLIEGEPMAQIPLRNRRKGPDGELQVTRISETMMRYSVDGHVGYGISEYLDQIVDGQPVGVEGERQA